MEKYKSDMIDTLLKLLSFDGEQRDALPGAPFGQGNLDALLFTLDLCKKFGFEVKNLDGYAGVADIGEGEPFGILGHLDTVPVGDGWTHNPYGELTDGVIYGRGALDDRGPVLACIYAVKALLDEGLTPKRKIRLIFGCNEETGWACIDHFNKVERMPDEGFSPDADFPVINCEKGIAHFTYEKEFASDIKISGGTRPNVVPALATAKIPMNDDNLKVVIASGLKYTTEDGQIVVTATGKAAHAAFPTLGENAIIKLLKALSPLSADLKNLYDAFAETDGSGAGLNLSDEVSGALTVNLGIIETIGGKLKFTIDIRYPVTVTETQLINIIDNCLPCYVASYSRFQKPLYVDKNDRLVTTLLDTYNDVTGEKLSPITIGGGTYARSLKKGVAFGPEFPGVVSTIHMPEERVPVSDLMKFANIYKEAIKRLCF